MHVQLLLFVCDTHSPTVVVLLLHGGVVLVGIKPDLDD